MNADPRRPDKVQRYVAKNTSNGEDLTPDYMNIMGQHSTTGNAAGEAATDKQPEPPAGIEQNLQVCQPGYEDTQNDVLVVTSNAANVIPTSPQYGVAIIPNANVPSGTEFPAENNANITSNETPTDPVPKPADETKDVHSTPSRNDRFKVVKIATLEPFKRGRWKCMDYVDEAPPTSVINNPITKSAQSMGNNVVPGGYMQTQSLPQQQIQQMLLQGGFTNSGQFIPNVSQMMPQAQYYYPQMANIPNQNMPQQIGNSMPAQFMNNQQYYSAGVVSNPAGFSLPQSYSNIQYVPMPAQNSAFVPTSQTMQMTNNYQQGQTYPGQQSISQANLTQQPMVNGHAYPSQPELQMNQQPNQAVKTIVNSMPQNVVPQQNHNPMPNHQHQQQQHPVIQQPPQQQHQYQSQSGTYQPGTSMTNPQPQHNSHQSQTNVLGNMSAPTTIITPVLTHQPQPPPVDANNVYNNPQFAVSVNSLSHLGTSENTADVPETNSVVETVSEGTDDPSKGAVVNAIDNKIEQAMDLVKSHLMYTVREEVEVLKEKIAELMEKIQQLETENNYLRSQIPKSQAALPPPPNVTPNYNNLMSQPQNMTALNQPQNVPSINPLPQNNVIGTVTGSVLAPMPQGGVLHNIAQNQGGVPHSISQNQGGVPHSITQNQGGVPHSIPQNQGGVPHSITQNQGGGSHSIPQIQGGVPQSITQNQGGLSQPQSLPQNQGLPPTHSIIPNNAAIPQSHDKAPNE